MIRDWFCKLIIGVRFRLSYGDRIREVFTWHGKLFLLGEHMLYEILEDHEGRTAITCRMYLDPEFNLESYMEHG